MTKRNRNRQMAAIMLLLAGLFAIGLTLKVAFPKQEEAYEFYSDSILIIVTALAAYLAIIFQQRAGFLQALRSLWSHLIIAKNDMMEYTNYMMEYTGDPSFLLDKYNAVYNTLSRAIDEMRGVYRNVGEDEHRLGLYPFEPLHDMRRALEELGCRNDPRLARVTQKKIEQAWNSLRFKFLREFDAPEPTEPILQHDSRDPRRPG